MAASDDAINFILQAENRLSPVLKTAMSDYERFTEKLEKSNRKAYDAASRGLSAVGQLSKGIAELPDKLASQYDAAMKKLKSKIEPITQEVVLNITAKGTGPGGSKGPAAKIATMLRNASIRLSATAPIERNPLFDHSQSMRQSMREQPQPPDYGGRIQGIPRFQKGGMVDGNSGEVDKVLAYLTPGEMVLPKEVVQRFRDLELTNAPKAIKESTREVLNLGNALSHVKQAAELGLDPEAPKLYEAGLKRLREQTQGLFEQAGNLSERQRRKMNPILRETGDILSNVEQEADAAAESLEGIGKDVKFLGVLEALREVQSAIGGVISAGKGLGSAFGVDEMGSFHENALRLTRSLAMSRREAKRFGEEALDEAIDRLGASKVNAQTFSHALAEVADSGVTSKEELKKASMSVAILTRATQVGTDEVAGLRREIVTLGSMSEEQFQAISLSMREMAAVTDAAPGETMRSLQQAMQGGLGAVLETVRDPKVKEQMLNAFVLSETALADIGVDQGSQFMQNMVAAMTDANVAARMAGVTGMTGAQIQRAFMGGDPSRIFERISARIQRFTATGNTQALQQLMEGLQFEGDLRTFIKLGTQGDKLQETFGQLVGKIQGVEGATEAMMKAQDGNLSTWQKISNFVSSHAINAFGSVYRTITDALNPAVISSTYYLGQMMMPVFRKFGPLLGGLTKRFVPLIAKLFGFTAASTTANVSMATTATTANAAQFSLAGFGAGLKAALLGIGQAIVAFGRMIFSPYGLAGLGALAAIVLTVGFSLRMAAPAFEAFASVVRTLLGAVKDIAVAAIEGVVTVLGSLFNMDWKQMLTSIPALLGLGAAFPVFGLGVLSMSSTLAMASPMLLVFAGAMKLLKISGAGGGIGEALSGLVDAFAIDPDKVRRATESLFMAGKFLLQFAAVSGMVAVFGGISAVVGLVEKAAGFFLGLFGGQSPMEALVSRGEKIVSMITGVASAFAGLNRGMLTRATDLMCVASSFMAEGLIPLMQTVDRAADVADGLSGGLFSDSAMSKLARIGPKLAQAIGTSVASAEAMRNKLSLPSSSDVREAISVAVEGTDEEVRDAVMLLHRDMQALLQVLGANPGGMSSRAVEGPQSRRFSRGEM